MVTLTPAELLGPLNDVEAKHAPVKLFVSGDRSIVEAGTRVAIVGSRDASDEGLELASEVSRRLVATGARIVSGLARGIDTAAHTSCIDAGGKTIAVLGTPLDKYAIVGNRPLQDFIAQEHLVVSQFPKGYGVFPGNFPMRNRTMAIICHGSVIIEAGDGSGTLSQGWEALRIGRPLFLSRLVLENEDLEWPKKMLEYGAIPMPDDPAELLGCLFPHFGGQEIAFAL